MSVEKVIVSIIGGVFQGLAVSILIKKQIGNLKPKNLIIPFILLFLYGTIALLFINNQLRFALFIVIVSLILYFILKIRDRKVIIYAFNIEILLSISEILVSLILVLLGFNSVDVVNNNLINLVANVGISLLAIILIYFKFIRKTLDKIIMIFDKNQKLINYFYIFIVILYLIILKNGFEFLLKSNYYINIFFIVGVVLILTLVIKNEFKYDQIKEQNRQMLNYVTKYEKIITEQGKANHEFKNQLMVIRGYAQMNSPKLIEYLDSIVDDTRKTHSSYLISQLNNFPDGGIKGLLYYKLSVMEDEEINYEINVESGVKAKLNALNTNMYKNITKILGVLLDNAIDASKQVKNKKVNISVSKEKSNIIFSIFNTYKGKIDLSKIGTGHTTKGKGHGYGLRLVEDIISNNKSFKLENDLEDDYYVSKLYVKFHTKRKNKRATFR